MCTLVLQLAQFVIRKITLDGEDIPNFEVLTFDAFCVRTAHNFKLGPPMTQSYHANHKIWSWYETLSNLKFWNHKSVRTGTIKVLNLKLANIEV